MLTRFDKGNYFRKYNIKKGRWFATLYKDYYRIIKGKYPGVPSLRAHIIFPGLMLLLIGKYFCIIPLKLRY